MPGILIGISSRTVSQRGEIIGTAPELRLTETDQTDPGGRYRLLVEDDSLRIERAATAGWASATELVRVDEAAGVLQVTLSGTGPELRFAETDQTDPAGRARFRVTSDFFRLDLALTASWASSVGLLAIQRDLTGTNQDTITLTSSASFIPEDTGRHTFLYVNPLWHKTASARAQAAFGIYTDAGIGATNTQNWTATPISMAGIVSDVLVSGGATGTFTGVAAFYARGQSLVAGTTTNYYGLYVADKITGATLTNQYGIKIEDIDSAATINVGIALGDGNDIAIHHKASSTLANTAVGGVLIGTPVTPIAPAADSLFIANITASGDILLAVNKGGASHMAFMADASTGDTIIQAATGQSVDVYIAGAKQIDYAAGAMAFQQATVISTTTGDLTLNPSGDLIINPTGGQVAIGTEVGAGGIVLISAAFSTVVAQTFGIRLASAITNSSPTPTNRLRGVILEATLTAGTAGVALGVLSQLEIAEPELTLNNNTVADATTLYILSSPTEGGTSNSAILLHATAVIRGLGSIEISSATNSLLFTGTLALTGSRVTQSYHTNITSTNAVTVDSSETVKHDITPYLGDALSIINGIDVITFRHDSWLDPSEELKLGIRAESVKESLALRMLKRDQGDYLGLNLYGLESLHTRAIQQLDEKVAKLERQLVAAGIIPEE